MGVIIDSMSMVIVLASFLMLSSGRVSVYIRMVMLQGILLGVITVLFDYPNWDMRILILAFGNILLKSVIFPWFIMRAVRHVKITRELNPVIGFNTSVFIGVILFSIAMWLAMRLQPFHHKQVQIELATSMFMVAVGLFMIISRSKAITHVVGYMVLENGIYLMGAALMIDDPLIVELGVFLDIFVAIFIMGIIIHQIEQQFDTLDVRELSHLRD